MEHEFFSAAFLSSLFAIILMDLVLAGDNALVIGLVARNLPKSSQRNVILCGTAGAIVVRAVMAALVVQVLRVPGFMLAGGIALTWIARKLLTPEHDTEDGHLAAPAATFACAVRTIIIADAVMGIDNVLAIGGAARGSVLLIVLGLAVSVPIIVWGSQLIIKLVDRYPAVILLGGAVLTWTGYSMIVREPQLETWFEAHDRARFLVAILTCCLAFRPWYRARLSARMRPLLVAVPALLVSILAFEVAASVWSEQLEHLLAGPA